MQYIACVNLFVQGVEDHVILNKPCDWIMLLLAIHVGQLQVIWEWDSQDISAVLYLHQLSNTGIFRIRLVQLKYTEPSLYSFTN